MRDREPFAKCVNWVRCRTLVHQKFKFVQLKSINEIHISSTRNLCEKSEKFIHFTTGWTRTKRTRRLYKIFGQNKSTKPYRCFHNNRRQHPWFFFSSSLDYVRSWMSSSSICVWITCDVSYCCRCCFFYFWFYLFVDVNVRWISDNCQILFMLCPEQRLNEMTNNFCLFEYSFRKISK